MPPRHLVGAKHLYNVAAIVLIPDVEQSFDVLNFPERFDDVRGWILLYVLDAFVEVVEGVVFDGVDTVL